MFRAQKICFYRINKNPPDHLVIQPLNGNYYTNKNKSTYQSFLLWYT